MRAFLSIARFQLLITGSATLLVAGCIGIAWQVTRRETLRSRQTALEAIVANGAGQMEIPGEATRFVESLAKAFQDKTVIVVVGDRSPALLFRLDVAPSGSAASLPIKIDKDGTAIAPSGYIAFSVPMSTQDRTITYLASESDVGAPLQSLLRKSIAIGALGVVLFGIIALILQRAFLRMEDFGRAASLLHELVHALSTATNREEVCAIVEHQLSRRFQIKYVTIAAVRSDSHSVLRGPPLTEPAWRAIQRLCGQDTGSVINLDEGYRVFILETSPPGDLEPTIVAAFPWPQPSAVSWDELTVMLLANLADQAFRSLERLSSIRRAGSEPFLRSLQESLLGPIASRSQDHAACSFIVPGQSLAGATMMEMRAGHALFFVIADVVGEGMSAVYPALTIRAALHSLRGLFGEDVVGLMSAGELLAHLTRVFGQECRDMRMNTAVLKLTFHEGCEAEYSTTGSLMLLALSDLDARTLVPSPPPRTQNIQNPHGTWILMTHAEEPLDDAFWKRTAEGVRKSTSRLQDFAIGLRTKCEETAPKRPRDVVGLLVELR